MAKKLINHNNATGEVARPNRIRFKLKPGRQTVRSPFRKIKPKNLWLAALVAVIAIAAVATFSFALAAKPFAVNRDFTEKSVGMQMFGFNWNSLKTECTDHLGPAQIDWILVDPPSDHITGTQWWIHYQPTNYDVVSNHGTREQFADMVATCKKAGVAVLADVVFNHMAGGSGDSFGGKSYSEALDYDGIYASDNFHEGLAESDKHFCDQDIQNWDELWERTNCRFPGLPDLATEQEKVRGKIANYLKDLQSLGVAGFRFDAAKHVDPADIKAILSKLDQSPFVIQEVPGDSTIAADYLGNGHVWAWQSASDLMSAFSSPDSVDNELVGLADLWAGGYPSDLAVTWVNNHDTERHGESLTYNDGDAYRLASLYLLAQPYGQPMLFSGYRFEDPDEGPAQDDAGNVLDAVCGQEYLQFNCFDRSAELAGLVIFRHELDGSPATGEAATDGFYSLERSGKGFFAFNYNFDSVSQPTIATGMPAGTYCNLAVAGASAVEGGMACREAEVEVDSDGNLVTQLQPMQALAITSQHKLG